VDTGGTYTDAVLMCDEVEVITKLKALITRHDLDDGVGAALRVVLERSRVDPLAPLSTTIANNALMWPMPSRLSPGTRALPLTARRRSCNKGWTCCKPCHL
jgi:hypothetical protein